ncbi:MAG: hypothetical protein KDE52_13325 [Calditrichaeota bacterium]|nr:hypothetical protein [Calditrichota bacterium]MCB0268595.1 hypothetical protein [Calditrichota bacterium]MCB0286537.1 hypothetical protein [Calditrichota bacterium]MCB0301030.1 hypothetical protein [Calditrichota bacterium]MCB9070553.1 hypothetical protein [Calditrichia bacterium]
MKILILTFFAIVTLSIAGNAQVAVIANKNVPVEEVKDIQLLDYYAGDIRTWADGTPIKVFDLKPKGEVRDLFFHFLGKTSSRMKSIWMKKMLSGEGNPPEALASETDMLKRVSATAGAIGFVSNNLVNDSVKVLVIIPEE